MTPTVRAGHHRQEDTMTAQTREHPDDGGAITRVNIYRHEGVWCYAALTDEGHDHSDTIGCDDGAGALEAADEAAEQFPSAFIFRVDDI